MIDLLVIRLMINNKINLFVRSMVLLRREVFEQSVSPKGVNLTGRSKRSQGNLKTVINNVIEEGYTVTG